MKRSIILGVSAIAMAAFTMSFVSNDKAAGKESASIVWTGKKVTGEHSGTIDFKAFGWKFDESRTLVSANFSVDMTSLVNTDMDGEAKTKLEGHLASKDFFNISEYPTANFVTTGVKSLGKGAYEIEGNLTIKGITNLLSFRAMIKDDGHMRHATAMVNIDRTKYDIRYGSGKFFEDLGDRMIDDEFSLQIDIKKH